MLTDNLGKALADRCGLPHDHTLRDVQILGDKNRVFVEFRVMYEMTTQEYDDLKRYVRGDRL